MATVTEIMTLLRPQGGWVVYGDTFDGIVCLECDTVTDQELADMAKNADALLAEKTRQEIEAMEAEKQRIAGALGITLDELKVLLS